MALKIQIESALQQVGGTEFMEFNRIVALATKCATLEALRLQLIRKSWSTKLWGMGSNHCWVKEVAVGEVNDQRLLFITENK